MIKKDWLYYQEHGRNWHSKSGGDGDINLQKPNAE